MKILVSACVMGCNCKYNGGNNRNEEVIAYCRDKEVVQICPELLANIGTPRPCAEIVDGVIMDEQGKNVDSVYKNAVELALSQIEKENIDLAILQSRSPTCGVNQIYDGTFSGNLIEGHGIFAKELIKRGYKVMDIEDFADRKDEFIQNLDKLHTTELGVIRIKKNLSIDVEDVAKWCREEIMHPDATIVRQGKNWYITIKHIVITVNAYSYTIITAHKRK